jgi:hypothetical protein
MNPAIDPANKFAASSEVSKSFATEWAFMAVSTAIIHAKITKTRESKARRKPLRSLKYTPAQITKPKYTPGKRGTLNGSAGFDESKVGACEKREATCDSLQGSIIRYVESSAEKTAPTARKKAREWGLIGRPMSAGN